MEKQPWAGLATLAVAKAVRLTKEFLNMPYVNIKITNEGVTKEQKLELVSGVTDLLSAVLGKNPATTVVVIDEVETDNWGIGGELVTDRRKRGT